MFWYYVEPVAPARWQLACEGQREPDYYDTREAACMAAEQAARGRFVATGSPSGVRVMRDGLWREDAVFAEGRGRRRG